MLATEPTTTSPLLETWSQNERLRHIPTASWMAQKLETDIRQRVEKLYASYAALPHDHAAHADLEHAFRTLCRDLDRVADVARRPRGQHHPPADLGHRIGWAISHAVANLNASDADTFGRRLPFQTFERSNAEPLYAAILSVIQRVQHLQELVRAIDPRIDEKLYDGLVVLQTPLRTDPIA
jgi:hypothetical protein